MATQEEIDEALTKLNAEHAEVMESMGNMWVAVEAVRAAVPTDNLHGSSRSKRPPKPFEMAASSVPDQTITDERSRSTTPSSPRDSSGARSRLF